MAQNIVAIINQKGGVGKTRHRSTWPAGSPCTAGRCFYWWLKYHLRRPSEARALQKIDYDKSNDIFTIKRAFSNKKLIERTKTKQIHTIPCHPDFKAIMEKMPSTFEPFFFVNPNGKLNGRHYQHDFLVDLWKKACSEPGENIEMYSGLKHSSCSQYINEKGLSIDELQMITDHARRESVLKYAKVQAETKRRLMMGKVIPYPKLSSDKKMKEEVQV